MWVALATLSDMMLRLARVLHRATDPSPRKWKGLWNRCVNEADDLDEAIEAFQPCCEAERVAAIELLATGLEERPLNAIERAHAVLQSAGVIQHDPHRAEQPWVPA